MKCILPMSTLLKLCAIRRQNNAGRQTEIKRWLMNEPRVDDWIETMQNYQAGWIGDRPSSGP